MDRPAQQLAARPGLIDLTVTMHDPTRQRGNRFPSWRGIFLVASTYIYFLIFAQFGFLKRLDDLALSAAHLKAVMAAMAIGGILSSLFASRLLWPERPRLRLQAALLGCALAATLTTLPLNLAAALADSAWIGLSLGTLTVTLVTNLQLWIHSRSGHSRPLFAVALGVGLGYFACNVPALFTATPRAIAVTAAAVSLIAVAIAHRTHAALPATPVSATYSSRTRFFAVLLWFTTLVWFDSAAFFIIQNSPALKSGTWQGTAHLWRTGSIHLLAAVAAAWFLTRMPLVATLGSAFGALAIACLFLLHPAHAAPAAFLYPIGVSLYSVALVAWPSYLLAASPATRIRRAGIIYAVAGWIGSALGIGMAQHLHRVPLTFIVIAAAAFTLPLFFTTSFHYRREVAAVVLVCAVSWCIHRVIVSRHPEPATASLTPTLLTPVQRGRRVYIAEGCINCHSQYVRPHSPDVEMWGPSGNLDAIRREKPPLIGNRRQGPDLTNVGSRRSPLWLRIHQGDPRALSYRSIMPSYAYLFKGAHGIANRGDNLIAYLSSLKSPDSVQHLKQEIASWLPSPASVSAAKYLDGAELYAHYCATCHSPGGYVITRWRSDFKCPPPDIANAPLRQISATSNPKVRRDIIARTIKFGILNTDMAGHEYLPDSQIIALADWVQAMRRNHFSQEQAP
jgi:cytochrome c oxidase cbb3-type subunit 2